MITPDAGLILVSQRHDRQKLAPGY